MSDLVDLYDSVIFDADGVLYRGKQAVEFSVDAIAGLRGQLPWSVVTNNAAYPPEFIASKLSDLDMPVPVENVITSPQGAVEYLRDAGLAEGSPVLVVGGAGIEDALLRGGYQPVRDRERDPRAVVQGFGPDVGWQHLAQACYAIEGGAQWVATNLDASIPLEEGFAPGNGALVEAVAHALGRGPDAATGKPEPLLFEIARGRMSAERPLVIGDRIDTDIRGGNRAGMDTLLVLTGVTGAAQIADLAQAPVEDRPRYLAADLRALSEPPEHSLIAPDGGSGAANVVTARSMLARAWSDPTSAPTIREQIVDALARG